MFAEAVVAFGVRATVGLVAGVVLAAIGYLVAFGAWALLPFQVSSAVPFAVTFAGIGGSAGALIGWALGDGQPRRAVLLLVTVTLVGGVAGSWAGYLYGRVAYENVVVTSGGAWGGVLRLFTHEINRPTAVAIMFGGAIGSNLFALFRSLVRIRGHGAMGP